MMKMIKSKKGEKFELGLLVTFLAITISLFSFMTEENIITGFAIMENKETTQISQQILLEFKDVDSLSTLSAGNYYIDSNGIVYWVDDELSPAIAKVNNFDENQKNRYIYIDKEGRIGYILDLISITENET